MGALFQVANVSRTGEELLIGGRVVEGQLSRHDVLQGGWRIDRVTMYGKLVDVTLGPPDTCTLCIKTGFDGDVPTPVEGDELVVVAQADPWHTSLRLGASAAMAYLSTEATRNGYETISAEGPVKYLYNSDRQHLLIAETTESRFRAALFTEPLYASVHEAGHAPAHTLLSKLLSRSLVGRIERICMSLGFVPFFYRKWHGEVVRLRNRDNHRLTLTFASHLDLQFSSASRSSPFRKSMDIRALNTTEQEDLCSSVASWIRGCQHTALSHQTPDGPEPFGVPERIITSITSRNSAGNDDVGILVRPSELTSLVFLHSQHVLCCREFDDHIVPEAISQLLEPRPTARLPRNGALMVEYFAWLRPLGWTVIGHEDALDLSTSRWHREQTTLVLQLRRTPDRNEIAAHMEVDETELWADTVATGRLSLQGLAKWMGGLATTWAHLAG